jgi:hypothetical protein
VAGERAADRGGHLAGEAGKAIQCKVTATYDDASKVSGTSQPYAIAAGSSPTAPPLAPPTNTYPAYPTLTSSPSELPVGESTGAELTCEAGPWTRNPATYTYRWYRSGTEIASTVATAATSDTYTLTAEDTEERAAFQCSVTAENAGGASTAFTPHLNSKPAPSAYYDPGAQVTVPPSHSSRILTETNGGASFEICNANPPSTDVCKQGAEGYGFGEFNSPRSIAVDNSPGGNGDVYEYDELNFRVQKFSADGQPILEFGKEVDEKTEADVCTAASGDPCGRGVKAVDESPVAIGYSGPYWFGDYQKEYKDLGNQLAVDQAGHVYLAEVRRGEGESLYANLACPEKHCGPRIQKWDSDGNYLSMAKLKTRFGGEFVGEGTTLYRPVSLTVNSNETVFASIATPKGVERITPDEFTPTGSPPTTPIGNFFLETTEPRQMALDPRNDRLLISDINEKESLGASEQTSVCGGPRDPARAVLELDTQMNLIDCTAPIGAGNMREITGMAVNKGGKLYAAAGNANVIKVFHLPVPAAPEITDEAAKKITTQSGELRAQINPGFEETTYRVEYGLQDCATSTCTSIEGDGKLGGLHFAPAAVRISGLQPNTTYHYRFIAVNAIGEDVGDDKTFTTYALVQPGNDPCPNALARKQTQAGGLLDCRGYELASAAWTGGYDVVSNLVPGQTPFQGYSEAPDKVLYGVKDGGIPGTGNPTNRGIDPYVAERDETNGWITRYVGIPSDNPYASGPFSSTLLAAAADLKTFVFGGPDICKPCFSDGSSGMPVRLPSGELIQGMAGTNSHPDAEEAGTVAAPLSADGNHLVFGSSSAFEPNATEGQATLYERDLTGLGPNTEVISTRSDGSTMTGEVGELAITPDGSRVVVAEKVGTDAAGNPLWHPYLHIRGSEDSIDLTEGATSGVYFSGMTADGSTIFMSTTDQLPVDQPVQDEDESLDIYRAQVDESGGLTLELVSVNSDGSVSNDDGCEPAGDPTSWNAIEGNEGMCNAVAFAGGAGVAADDGTFYFVSPEELEPGKGIENQANLYVVHPGGSPAPQFVALIDNALEKPGQQPPQRPLLTEEFGGDEYTLPGELTVDQSNQDLYAVETAFGSGKVFRYHADGSPDPFSAGPTAGTNHLDGIQTELGSWNQIAVDNSPASQGTELENALYVPGSSGVHVYASTGESLGLINGSGTVNGVFGRACGVAVDQSSGIAYVADHNGHIWQYTPSSPSGAIDDTDYTVKGITTTGVNPCSIAVDTIGNVYAAQEVEFFSAPGPAFRWSASSFTNANPAPSVTGAEVTTKASALSTDPVTNELYVDAGKELKIFDSSGNEIAKEIGKDHLNCSPEFNYSSRGVAVNATTKHTFASCLNSIQTVKGTIREWGYSAPAYEPVDNPAIRNGVMQPEVHSWGDFQITPEARYAAFSTVVPLKPGYDNGGKYEVYRYTDEGGELLCVSCNPTGSQASSDSMLAPSGLGLLTDGRLFFNSGEALTLSDTNEKLDAYEWSPVRQQLGGCKEASGCQQLISTGTSAHPSSLLGVSSDGKDAFFFTRDVLVPADKNGQAMKIYDAREQGGIFVIPPPPPCAASDECHGPGTQAQASPQIGSYKGTGGQANEVKCKKGFHKKKGHCVRKGRHRKHHKRKAARHHRHRAGQGGVR